MNSTIIETLLSRYLNANTRIDIDHYYITIALLASARSTCARRKVGAVLVDGRNRVLSIGYNGVASGQKHCIDEPCPGANYKSGEGLDICESIHAEVSALGACHNIQDIRKVYCTVSPCINCIKSLLSTPCEEIIFSKEYSHIKSKELWEKSGRIWRKIHE